MAKIQQGHASQPEPGVVRHDVTLPHLRRGRVGGGLWALLSPLHPPPAGCGLFWMGRGRQAISESVEVMCSSDGPFTRNGAGTVGVAVCLRGGGMGV